ncbi:MAG: T9SS type A sorting domain-containing protein [Lewinellaceae bacterium]|nr:T9SS type A sorting domain-containing protein [Lewinellaceae bacterium]
MKVRILISAIAFITFANCAKTQDSTALVSAFFGLDNALPFQANFLCPGAFGMDGMPVNFKFPIDASSLSASDFEVVDSLGNIHIPICAVLAPANENGENRTVLLIGELGNAAVSPPVEVRVVGDLFTINTLPGESACSEIMNLNGISTTNVVRLYEGPSLFFAQKIDGNLNECSSGIQTIQVAWNGGITPYISGDTESDLFQYYIGYSDSSGVLIPHVPISIADINDNDNFHQLCFSTIDPIIKISMMANTVEDPNQDPNLYSEIDVSYCENLTPVEENLFEKRHKIYPNPFSDEIFIENLIGDEYFIIYDFLGRKIIEGKCFGTITLPEVKPGIYYLTILNNSNQTTYKLIKR